MKYKRKSNGVIFDALRITSVSQDKKEFITEDGSTHTSIVGDGFKNAAVGSFYVPTAFDCHHIFSEENFKEQFELVEEAA